MRALERRLTRPTKRSYGQYCALAAALDAVGERWTLLIVRELLIRPRRYAELLQALPGIGTNLLAERLHFLTEIGVLRTINQGEPRSGYELTPRGEALREPVLALARWGLDTMAEHARADRVQPGWARLGVEALIDHARAPGVDEDYVFHVDGEIFTIVVRGGHATIQAGEVDNPAITVTTDASTLIDVGSGRLNPITALVANRVSVVGDPDAMPRCLRLLGLSGGSDGPATAALPGDIVYSRSADF
jgi:DNA-binding HxlR family transcriptional regulator